MTTKEWRLSHEPSLTRRLAASTLMSGSRWLTRFARRLSGQQARGEMTAPVYEFHAEAGAPEGALYVDGKLVGHLTGVNRL